METFKGCPDRTRCHLAATAELRPPGCLYIVLVGEMWCYFKKILTKINKAVKTEIDPHPAGKSTDDGPVLACLARRERRPAGILHAPLGIDIDAVLLGIGGPRKNDVRHMSAAVTMMPLFLPEGFQLNKLVQAIVGVCLFSSAYMAEIVRGGLQAIPRGQYEAAESMGLNYWQSMNLIVLPQALKLMIPNIVGNFIGLLKDTTLVSIIGLYDMLLMIKASGINPKWNGLHTEPLFLGAVFFFIICYVMSQYSQYLERKLATDHRK